MYDSVGRLVGVIDPRGHESPASGGAPAPGAPSAAADNWTSELAWTDDDQIASTTDAMGGTTTWSYDALGRLASAKDAAGRTTTYTYDAADQVTSVQGPDPQIPAATLTYDANGNATVGTDAAGRTTVYTYDLANRPVKVVSPLGTYSYGYDAAGNLNAVTAPGNRVTRFIHDAANRIIKVDYPSGKDPEFRYNANGARSTMIDANTTTGTVSYAHDALDRLTTVTRGTQTYRYAYTASNAISRITYPDGTVFDYSYGDDNELLDVSRGGVSLASYEYDVAGNVTSLQRGNGTSASYEYDRRSQLVQVVDQGAGGEVLLDEAYSYDAVGDLTQTFDGVSQTATAYAYDDLRRLVATCYQANECSPGTNSGDYIQWAYDVVGNRTNESRPNGTTTYAREATTGRLSSTSGPEGVSTYTYDALGQLTKVVAPGGTTTSTYTVAGRLASQSANGVTSSYTYDGDGRRLSATTGGSRTNYGWLPLGYQLATETAADGSSIRRYAYGAGMLGFEPGPGSMQFHHGDRQNSVRAVTGAAGDTQWLRSWEPFGVSKSTTQVSPGAVPGPIGWVGQFGEFSSVGPSPSGGQTHLRARQYLPQTGSFSTPDPVSGTTPAATYSYASGNPLSFGDPSGLASDDFTDDDVNSIASSLTTIAHGVGMISPTRFPLLAASALSSSLVTTSSELFLSQGACNGGKGSCAGELAQAAAMTGAGFVPGLGPVRGIARSADDILPTPVVTSDKLQNIVNNLYKGTTNPNRLGNGTTMDAIRNEVATGVPTSGRMHLTKGEESLRGLENWLVRNPDAPYQDRLVAQSLADELRSVLPR